MTIMKKQFLYILAGATLILGACNKWVDDVYRNPNAPVVVEPEVVLPSIHGNLARGIHFDSRIVGNLAQHWARTVAADLRDTHGYIAGNDFGGEKWRIHYWNLGHNLLNVIKQTRTDKPEFAGVSYALFAFSWLQLADHHGPVILKQAFETDRLSFDYDEQQEVYQYVLQQCDSAELYLKRAMADGGAQQRLAEADRYFYNGNIDNYLRFTYGVKALAYHRYWNKADYKADSVIKYVNQSFTSAAQDAFIKYDQNPLISDQRNFFGPVRNNMGAYRPTQYAIDLFKGVPFNNATDPRLAYIFPTATDGQYRGIVPGLGFGTQTTNQRPLSFWGINSTGTTTGGSDATARTYFLNSGPFPILTYTWLQFVKAEAAFKKGDRATALTAYKAGIGGHFEHLKRLTGYVDFTNAQRDAYLNNPAVVPTTVDGLTRSMILLQKFMALWGYGFDETWVDLRKDKYSSAVFTGFKLPDVLFADNNGKPAYRFRPRYNSEYLWNAEALQKVGGFDADYHTKEVWFVNP